VLSTLHCYKIVVGARGDIQRCGYVAQGVDFAYRARARDLGDG
jgi:hypothetical protein